QYYYNWGRLSQSLNMLKKSEALAESIGDSASLFSNLRQETQIYMRTGNMKMLRSILNRRQVMIDNKSIKDLSDTSYFVMSQNNSLGLYYALPQINKQDSVKYYFSKLYNLGKVSDNYNLWLQLGSGGLAGYFSSKQMYDSAFYYYKLALSGSLLGKRMDNYNAMMILLAKSYNKAGQTDSSFKYAYQVYNSASSHSYLSVIYSSAGLLADLYKQQSKYDSAVKYMTIESQYKDSVSGNEALQRLQAIASEQQFKEMEQQKAKEDAVTAYKATLKTWYFLGGLLLLLLIIAFMYRTNKQRSRSKMEIEKAYNNLKDTQAQLIQSEKMASLGELTAGIAHEIQNPLNFVNNFSELNTELIDEIKTAIDKNDYEEVKALAKDVDENEQKILFHGKRADAIVKGMLQHSRSSTGVKEPTDINALCDEYLRLSYHGLRAKDKSFNATMVTDFDDSIGKINILPQELGRVILNLLTNAFYAVDEKKKEAPQPPKGGAEYVPTVSISTKRIGPPSGAEGLSITVSDNGNGIPQNVIDKIFQPFFTTKPTGQGTGLGLSMSYDIITKGHAGTITAETIEKKGTTFKIILPL
ncbi:MAG: ATP-binding protein, partial [Ferruginibacter sp.]